MNIQIVSFTFTVFCALLCYFLPSAHQSSTKNTTPDYLENLLNTSNFNEFSDILHIPNPDLVDPTQRKALLHEQYFFNGLEFGDILLRPGQLLNDEKYFNLSGHLKLSVNKWEDGIVPYYISKNFEDNQTDFINKEIEYTNKELAPNVEFRPFQDGDKDYVMFFQGGSGCYSNLGKVGGPQVISLSDPCFLQGFITHEMQHVLGIAHEHNRIDRDDYVGLKPHNIPQTLKSQYEKYSADQFVNTGPFNYYSIMNYPVKVPGFSELYAFDLYASGIEEDRLGMEKYFDPTDIERVKILYPL